MRKLLFTATLALILGIILVPLEGLAQMGPGMMGPEEYGEWNYCPYCGQPLWGHGMMRPGYGRGYRTMPPGWGMGPGMMGPGMMGRGMMGPGAGMGPSMMGPGYGSGYGFQYGPRYQQRQEPLKEKDAREMVENYLRSTRNPNLKMGEITDKEKYFEAEILTNDGSLADKIAVDKTTGWMRSIY
jgi:hypothetical protein